MGRDDRRRHLVRNEFGRLRVLPGDQQTVTDDFVKKAVAAGK
jgi:hypothetical protein